MDDTFWRIDTITNLAPDSKSVPAAREVLKKGGFGTVVATADGRGWWVVCKGITDTYEVSVRRDADSPACDCTCPSPKYPCKHALALMLYLCDHPELRVEKEESRREAGDFEALVRAVFAEPDDDTPRLVFADFLDENDQPDRAALIRLQCEKHRLKRSDPRWKALAEEEEVLERRLFVRHVEPLPHYVSARFVRGFLHVECQDTWLGNVDAMPARYVELFRGGWVESVELTTHGHITSPQLELCRLVGTLDVSRSPLREEGLLILAADAPVGAEGSRLARVKIHPADEPVYGVFTSADPSVRLPRTPRMHGPQGPQRRYNNLTASQVGLLIRAGRFEGVEVLHLDGPIGDAGAALLADTDDLRRVHELTLSGSRLTPDGAVGLVALGHLPALRELSLINALTGPEAFAAMVRGSGLARLTGLYILGQYLGDAGVRALAGATHFSHLETIRLFTTGATASSLRDLLASGHFPELGELHVQGDEVLGMDAVRLALGAHDRRNLVVSQVDLRVSRAVAADGGFHVHATGHQRGRVSLGGDLGPAASRIVSLEMQAVGLGAKAVSPLAACLSAARLKELDLSDNSLGNDGAAALATAFRDFRPETLNLSRNVIRKSGAVALGGSPVLSGLRVLDLSHNNIGFSGASAIVNSPHLGQLKELRLQGTNLTLNEWKEIEKKVGKKVLI